MSRRAGFTVRIALAGALLLSIAGLGLGGCGGEAPPRYDNLVLIMVDTLRQDHLPSYGYRRDTAPYLTELATAGVQLDGYAASSWTKSSIATLLTGLHPQRHQAIGRADQLPEDLAYLPEMLQENGFATAAFIGNRNAGRRFGFGRGYDRFQQTHATGKIDGERVTDYALVLSDELRPPFFLQVHYVDPHTPYRPPAKFSDRPDISPQTRYLQPKHLRGRTPTEAELRLLVDLYDGEIFDFDYHLRRLMIGLEARGLLERTLLVITSDHGEEFGEHGGLEHGATLFEEVIAVPMILWAEEGLAAARAKEPFHQVDFLPTALEALGIQPPEGLAETLDGVSRWPRLARGRGDDGPLYFHLDLDRRGALALRNGPDKLIHNLTAPHNRVYDLAADPEEQSPRHELRGDEPETLRQLLNHHNRLGALAARRRAGAVDGELRQSLAALGYLEMSTPQEELEHRAVPARLDRELGFAAPPPGTE